MRCPDCGSNIPAGHGRCPECGYMLTQAELARMMSQRRRQGRRRMLICVLVVVVVLGLVAGIVLLLLGRGDKPGESPPPSTQAPAAAEETSPPATMAPTQAPTEAPRPEQTSVSIEPTSEEQTGVLTGAKGDPGVLEADSLSSARELYALARQMRNGGYTQARVANMRLTTGEIDRASESIFGCQQMGYMLMGTVAKIQIKWYTGVRVWQAVQNGTEGELNATEQEVLRRAREILNEVTNPGMSEREREIAIYDYITHHTEYRIDAQMGTDSAAGCLLNGVAQCSGYSDTFFLLGRLAGLEIDGMNGTMLENGIAHNWNLIRLDGLWYAADVTWGDPVGSNPAGGDENDLYLNIPNGMFESSRSWDAEQAPDGPFATELDANWYYADLPRASDAQTAVQMVIDELDAGEPGMVILDYGGADEVALANAISDHYRSSVSYHLITELPGIVLGEFHLSP